MAPGPYAICLCTMQEPNAQGVIESDGLTYTTLMFGYDTAVEAWKELPRVAAEEGVDAGQCAVIRHIDEIEASKFME